MKKTLVVSGALVLAAAAAGPAAAASVQVVEFRGVVTTAHPSRPEVTVGDSVIVRVRMKTQVPDNNFSGSTTRTYEYVAAHGNRITVTAGDDRTVLAEVPALELTFLQDPGLQAWTLVGMLQSGREQKVSVHLVNELANATIGDPIPLELHDYRHGILDIWDNGVLTVEGKLLSMVEIKDN